MITGISHITFIVKDIEASARLLKTVFDAEEVYASGEKTFSLSQEKFFTIGGVWICLMEGEPLPGPTYNHIAFRIPDDEYDLYIARVLGAGVAIRPTRPRVEGEGRSIYFYDFDHHLFELHTGTLQERLSRYAQ